MAYVSPKMDDTQIANLANEITKTYMTGKNTMSQEDFARQYYAMLQNTMKMISEEQRKQSQIDEIANYLR